VAFLVMDLQKRQQPEAAQRFLNNYLQHTGDYGGLVVLRFYQVYRALVRAKIDAIRAHQAGINRQEQSGAEKDFLDYLNLALGYVRAAPPQLIIMRGMSASGKSTISQVLLEKISAIRIRSDVERKRLFGLQPEDNGQAALGKGIYTTEATWKTYRKLQELAAGILDAGYSVIVDAVFLTYEEREQFRKLAERKQTTLTIVECIADRKTLTQRIGQRKKDVSDADLQVLEMQVAKWQPLRAHERKTALTIDTTVPVDVIAVAKQLNENTSLCFSSFLSERA